jgi:N-acetylglucosamine-6-sulfatase
LYDLQNDPIEAINLALDPVHQSIVEQMKQELFSQLTATQGMYIPLQPDRGNPLNLRNESGSPAAAFPTQILRNQPPAGAKRQP